MICFNCKKNDECQSHHVVPKSKGGSATVDLCLKCHSLAHSKKMSAGRLTSDAMQKMKKDGLYTGGKPPYGKYIINGMLITNIYEYSIIKKCESLRRKGYSLRAIAKTLSEEGYKTREKTNFSHTLIHRMTT